MDSNDGEASWDVDIEQWIAELDQGTVKPILWAEAKRKIFGDTDIV
ncbi:MAG: hypothetical protein K2R98_00060 [Gemmataceae bacterium]|nr:hypothetical protein [Gemmataceae bacterium]